MSDPMSCMECRPHWQRFRAQVDEGGVPAERRGLVIKEYLRLLHDLDHDEDRVRAHLEQRLKQVALEELIESARAGTIPPTWPPSGGIYAAD